MKVIYLILDCCCSVTKSRLALWDPMDCSTPGLLVLRYLPECAQTQVIVSMMPSNHLILCCPLLLPPSIFPNIRVSSNELVLQIRWPKFCSFGISPSSEYSGLISFKMDWLNLLAIQGTLKSLLQHPVQKQQSLALSLLCGPTLTSICDYCKNHSFD